MAADHERRITRGFLFADLRGYTDSVEHRGAAATAELLTRYRALAREGGIHAGETVEADGRYVGSPVIIGADLRPGRPGRGRCLPSSVP